MRVRYKGEREKKSRLKEQKKTLVSKKSMITTQRVEDEKEKVRQLCAEVLVRPLFASGTESSNRCLRRGAIRPSKLYEFLLWYLPRIYKNDFNYYTWKIHLRKRYEFRAPQTL